MENIATRIKEIRRDNNLSQSDLGKILSVSQDTVSLWETGNSYPSVQHVIFIAKAFNLSADYILGLSEF